MGRQGWCKAWFSVSGEKQRDNGLKCDWRWRRSRDYRQRVSCSKIGYLWLIKHTRMDEILTTINTLVNSAFQINPSCLVLLYSYGMFLYTTLIHHWHSVLAFHLPCLCQQSHGHREQFDSRMKYFSMELFHYWIKPCTLPVEIYRGELFWLHQGVVPVGDAWVKCSPHLLNTVLSCPLSSPLCLL